MAPTHIKLELCLFKLSSDGEVPNYTYASCGFDTSKLFRFEITGLRSACTLIHLKVRRQVSKLGQLATVQHVMINNHGILSESTPLRGQ